MNSNGCMWVQVRVHKKYFFEFKFEFGKMIEFFRVQVRVCSSASYTNRISTVTSFPGNARSTSTTERRSFDCCSTKWWPRRDSHLSSNLQSINQQTHLNQSINSQATPTSSINSRLWNVAHALTQSWLQRNLNVQSSASTQLVPQVRNNSKTIALYINRISILTSFPGNDRSTTTTERRSFDALTQARL